MEMEYGWVNARTYTNLERFGPPEHNNLHHFLLYCSDVNVSCVDSECVTSSEVTSSALL
jgi:hypothetical protein